MKKIPDDIKIIQAPLAGISDIVYRNLVRKYCGNTLLTTEMISSEAIVNNPKASIIDFKECEYPLSFQLSGHKPQVMARAAKFLNERASSIDINFGCPVNKIVKGSDGCAMMKNIPLATDIVKAVKDVIDVPLSAKFRLGWSLDEINFIEFAKALEEAGVDFITVHGRTRSQMYAGTADWQKIGLLKNEIKIPYFANGDIKTPQDALNCLKITGANGVSIGRGLMGDPTLCHRIEKLLLTGELIETPNLNKKINMLKEHIEGEVKLRGELNAIKFMRKFYNFYISSVRDASKYRQVLVRIEKKDEVFRILDEILSLHLANSGR